MTGPERKRLRLAVDRAVERRLGIVRDPSSSRPPVCAIRECSRCYRDLPHDEFPASRTWCRTCEALRMRLRRAATKAAA